ncbi:MAG: 4-oxalocrotonate tautomerase DmpI [bacterium]
MPSVKIEGPAIKDLDVKRELVKDVTDALVKAYGMPKGIMVVLIKENSPENVGVGGELVSDRIKTKQE